MMIKKLTKLVDVKSIITLLFGGVFSYLAVIGKISEDSFMTVFVMIMTYYFAKAEEILRKAVQLTVRMYHKSMKTKKTE